MKANLPKRLKVYENTIASLDKHLPVWQHVKEMTRTHDRFVRNFKKLKDHKAVLDRDLKSMRDKHLRIRKELVDRIIPVLGVISMFAEDLGNKVLKKQFSVKAKQVGKMKDSQLLTLSEAVISISTGEKKGKSGKLNPSDYGLTKEMAEGIKTKWNELKGSLESLKETRKERNRSTQAAERLISRNDKLLKSRTDKFVLLFRKSNAAFYQDYKQARKARSTKPEAAPVKSKAVAKPKPTAKPKAPVKASAKAKPEAPAKAAASAKPEPKLEQAETV